MQVGSGVVYGLSYEGWVEMEGRVGLGGQVCGCRVASLGLGL